MSEWLDIESAPKDGTEIILMKGNRVTAGSCVEWQETESHYDSAGNFIINSSFFPITLFLAFATIILNIIFLLHHFY